MRACVRVRVQSLPPGLDSAVVRGGVEEDWLLTVPVTSGPERSERRRLFLSPPQILWLDKTLTYRVKRRERWAHPETATD